jgi:hypothetical protein
VTKETKEARLKERDRVHKHYRAVTAKRHLEIRDRIPAAAAFADWLATNPNSDDRADAVTLLQVPLLELDGMADPLWDEPPSTYQALRDATLYNKPTKSTSANPTTKKDTRTMITISINIADPSDAARIPALLASLAQFGAAVPVTPVALTPVPQVVATEVAAIAIQATESAKRPGRRTKAEIEAAAAPVVEVQSEPVVEPVVEAPVVEVPPEPVIEVQPETVVVGEPAVPAKEYKADDVLEALKAFARTPGGVPKIKEILAQFDATNLATIKPADYAAVIAALAVPA